MMWSERKREWFYDCILMPVIGFIILMVALHFHAKASAKPYETFRFGEFNQLGRIDTRSGEASMLASGQSGKPTWIKIQESVKP